MSKSYNVWVMILGLGAVTLVCRSLFLLFGSKLTISTRVQQGLKYAPLGAFIAILVPELLLTTSPSSAEKVFSVSHPQFSAGIAAALCFVVSRSMLATIMVGMTVFTVFRLYVGASL